MVIVGQWVEGLDGVTRPMIRVGVTRLDGSPIEDAFLVDVGADRTVLSAHFFTGLRLPGRAPDPGMMLEGISGKCTFVWIHTPLEFTREDGTTIRVHGEYAALTDSNATDFSILGRDVLNNFDVIISRLRDEVLLLAERHRYQVIQD
jgi:Retroviral aspartyl protease